MLTQTTPIQMELEEALFSNGLLQGTVIFDTEGVYKKGDAFRARYTEIAFGDSGNVLFRCGHRVVLIWYSPRKSSLK